MRKNKRSRLHPVVKDLERANRDLEQFAYVASHDLQTPLRKVKNFTMLLRDEYSHLFEGEPEALQYMDFIISGADTAQHLVNGLLAFSRTGRIVDMSWFSMRDALEDALEILSLDINEKGVTIESECDKNPDLYADRMLIGRVFQNIIGNAIKFRHPNRPIIVKLCCSDEGDEWHIQISDNGQGFDPQYAERIFTIFQRLTEHKNGAGLGLALCRKIIDRHGGSIWAESSPEGSTFHFTLPKRSPEDEANDHDTSAPG